MKQFHNIHKNERAFIICNGPGLDNIDVSLLNNDIVFIMNRGYRLEKRGLDISRTYFVAIDAVITAQFYDEFRKIECKAKFCNRIGEGESIYGFGVGNPLRAFQTDMTKGIRQFHSVTNVALQIAYWMGCDPVYIVGMDHKIDYSTSKKVKVGGKLKWVVQESDKNHFDPDYLPEGTVYSPQDLRMVAFGYMLAREAFERDGRTLLNLSTPTHLSPQIMPIGSFEEIMK